MESDNRFSTASIAALAAALAKAQASMTMPKKNKRGAYGPYADIAAILEAALPPLSANGLSISQSPEPDGHGGMLLRTLLMHASGEWMASEYPLRPPQNTLQSMGSAITYARRYALSCMVGLAGDEDDEGEQAMPDKHAADRAFSQPVANNNKMPAQRTTCNRNRSATPPAAPAASAAALPQETSEAYTRAMTAFEVADTPEQLRQAGVLVERIEDAVEKRNARAYWVFKAQQVRARQNTEGPPDDPEEPDRGPPAGRLLARMKKPA